MKQKISSERPEGILTKHLNFLDRLRESGVTNMFGAGEYLETQYEMDSKMAGTTLMYWMSSFGKEDR